MKPTDSPKPRATWLVPLLLWLVFGLAANLAAWQVVERMLSPPADQAAPAPAPPAALRGRSLTVPAGGGFWMPLLAQGTTVLVRRAEADGAAVVINLCAQRKFRPDAPMQIYPIAVAGDWAALRAEQARDAAEVKRLPLVVAKDVAASLPRLVIRGDYRGRLVAHVEPATATGAWAMVLATGADRDWTLAEENWLLWREAESAEGYDHGLRIRRLPDSPQDHAACRETTEKLEFQLFRAAASELAARQAEIVVAAQGSPAATFRLPAGEHRLPVSAPAAMEDRALFEQAQAAGLIRREADGRLAWSPADAARAQAQGQPLPRWQKVNFAASDVLAAHRALYRSANGEFVRARLADFNAQQSWLALRVRVPADVANSGDWGAPGRWRAERDRQALALASGMPEVAVRLFQHPLVGWSEWLRVSGWPQEDTASAGPVRLRLTPLPGAAGRHIELLVLGQVQSVAGAEVLAQRAACEAPGCPARDVLTLLELRLANTPVELTVLPEPRFNRLRPASSEAARVAWRNDTLAWRDSPAGQHAGPAAEVTLLARDGSPLVEQGLPTANAGELGLAELLGIAPSHGQGVAGNLARLGDHGFDRVVATTTLDPRWQRLADRVLACAGQREGRWDRSAGACRDGKAEEAIPARRRSALVVLDAGSGDVLAAAGAPHMPASAAASELIAFSRFNPAADPLRANAWQHSGGGDSMPGSCFKLVDALALEAWAAGHADRQQLLAGLTPAELDTRGAALGFRASASCYPAPCGQLAIANFRQERPDRYLRNGRFGLAEALEHSVNSWFAWAVETSDATAAIRSPGALPQGLGASALEEARPVLAMAHQLGFGQAQRLDGGLLPADFAWRDDDHLQTVASRFDPLADPHQIRLQAIGQRAQATALQMAEVAAAIATGRSMPPRLLLKLNDREAATSLGANLDVDLARIRNGMKAVVDSGTARTAFAGPDLAAIRAGLFAKTGTAEIASGAKSGQGPQAGNVVSFVGYLAANTLPDQPRPLAFAVFISDTSKKAGEHAARVMADLLAAVAAMPVD